MNYNFKDTNIDFVQRINYCFKFDIDLFCRNVRSD